MEGKKMQGRETKIKNGAPNKATERERAGTKYG